MYFMYKYMISLMELWNWYPCSWLPCYPSAQILYPSSIRPRIAFYKDQHVLSNNRVHLLFLYSVSKTYYRSSKNWSGGKLAKRRDKKSMNAFHFRFLFFIHIRKWPFYSIVLHLESTLVFSFL